MVVRTKLTLPSYQHYLNPFLTKLRRKSDDDLTKTVFFMDVETILRHLFPAWSPLGKIGKPQENLIQT